ncbi:MAG: helix-turn-helix domain-containing protein [Erysipelotrichaceae bacterium]
METGEVIKKLRNEKKFTQSELGIMLGVNTSSIQKYESGATKNLKLETIRELCHIFDVPPIVFVLPETLDNGYDACYEKMFKEYLKMKLDLNNEDIQKIHDYIDDIRSMPKYQKSR